MARARRPIIHWVTAVADPPRPRCGALDATAITSEYRQATCPACCPVKFRVKREQAARKRRFLRGDASGIDQTLYTQPLTLAEAQRWVDRLRTVLPVPRITVLPGRRTRRRRGYAITGWDGTRSIVLHPIGLNVGTLLHEFAHHLSPRRGHGPAFKQTQRDVIATYQQLTRLTPVVS